MKALLISFILILSFASAAQDDYDLARKHFHENTLDSARYYINRTLGKKPKADDYFLSGLIHEAEKKDLRALADYEAVVLSNPYNLEAYFQKGLIYYNSASTEKAIDDFTYVIENQARSETNAIYIGNDPYGQKGTFLTTLQSMLGRVYQHRGLAFRKLGKMQLALHDFNKSFEYDTIADFYINRSQLYTKMNQEELAKNDLNSAIELEPNNYLAWYNLVLLDDKVRLPAALVQDDEFAPMLNLLGANAFENKEYALSAEYHTKAIERNPEDELAYLNRGKSLLKIGAYKQARTDFLKAMQINTNNYEVFYLVGNSLFYEERFDDAIGFYERYLSIDRGHKNVWYNAAMAYLSIENNERACTCLTSASDLGMGQAQEALQKYCQSE